MQLFYQGKRGTQIRSKCRDSFKLAQVCPCFLQLSFGPFFGFVHEQSRLFLSRLPPPHTPIDHSPSAVPPVEDVARGVARASDHTVPHGGRTGRRLAPVSPPGALRWWAWGVCSCGVRGFRSGARDWRIWTVGRYWLLPPKIFRGIGWVFLLCSLRMCGGTSVGLWVCLRVPARTNPAVFLFAPWETGIWLTKLGTDLASGLS